MGFDVERFLESIDEALKCSICFGVLQDPLAAPCGHVYCAQCIVQWVAESGTCPLTCEQLSVGDLKRILPLTSLIAKLNVRCANFRRGCPVILKVETQHAHLSKCQYTKVNYSKGQTMEQTTTNSSSPETREFSQVVVCQKGCGLPLLYQEPNSHNCVKALQTQVASLQMKLTRMEHENDMVCERTAAREENFQHRILNLEKELHGYEIHALNFERKLREYRSQNGYLQKQLNIRSDQAIEETEVEVVLERTDGSLGFNIIGGSEVGSNSIGGGGIVVSRVAEGGPASKSEGLKMNDEIIKVNEVDLSEASHEKAVATIKTAESPIHIVVRRKIDPPIECEINSVVSTGTQTDMPTHDVDTDSGIHERFSPRQDELCLRRLKSLDDGTSSSECSHGRFNFSKDDLELAKLRNGFETYEPKCNGNGVPHITLLVQDVNYVRDGTDQNSNVNFDGQSYVTAVSDQVYFDPELDYEYEEITLWFGECDLGLTFCCGEEDESAVYVCEIEAGSVAYLDGRIVLWDQVLKINDIPVASIEDIEPMVFDSAETIKFLVARPAQEVQATLIGSEGSSSWEQVDALQVNSGEYNDYSIGVIQEEDEDAVTVNSEKTTGDKCEKDSGVGRTDDSTKTESSEQDLGEETAVPQEDENRKCLDALEQQIIEINTSSVDTRKESRNKESGLRSGKSRSSDSSSNAKSTQNGSPKKSQNNSSKTERKNDSPPRKEKDKSERKKNHRDSSREHSEHRDDRESREKCKYSDGHRRSRKLAHVDRNIRASYMRACTTDSMQQIAVFGSPDHSPTKNSSRKRDKRSSRDNLNDQQQSANSGQQNIEWKVKVTRDRSQIFIRKRPCTNHRQARNKLLRERAHQLSEERKGLTTEDDAVSVYQGRYWPRDTRRRQLQKVREARKKKTEKLTQRLSDSPHTNSGSESGKGRKDSIVELSHRRMHRTRDHHFDDFVTVQEILTQRNPGGLFGGPIHVTTV